MKKMRRICPKCGCKEFTTTAHVMQEWKVDGEGNFIETVDPCLQVDHYPDPDNIWTCCRCGSEAVEENDFPFDQDVVTIYCESGEELVKNNTSCYITVSKEENCYNCSLFSKDKKPLSGEVCICKNPTAEHTIDDIPFVLETLFGLPGVKMTANWNDRHWYELSQPIK